MTVNATTARERCEDRLDQIAECMRGLGSDPHQNIQALTGLCGQVLEATCALYSRFDGPVMCVLGEWNAPPDLPRHDRAAGHICFDVVQQNSTAPLLVRDLPHTSYSTTDPTVLKYGLQTYLGLAVSRNNTVVGSLCALFEHDFAPTELQSKLLGLLGAEIGLQEAQLDAKCIAGEKEELSRHQLNAIPVGVFLIDEATRRVVDANQAVLSMIGAEREQVVGQLCHRYMFPAEPGGCPITDLALRMDWAKQILLRADGSRSDVLKTVTELKQGGRTLLLECIMDLHGKDCQQDGSETGSKESPQEEGTRVELHVLLVSPAAQDMATPLVDGLRLAGCILHTAREAGDALDLMQSAAASETPFHAIIVDQRLTGVDTHLFAGLVREDKRIHTTPLLLMHDGNDENFSASAMTGYDDAIVRSIDAVTLAAKLRSLKQALPPDEPVRTPVTRTLPVEEGAEPAILLVEDNEINTEVAREMIHHFGYRCDHAENGHAAVDAVRERHYDLILMDCQMPGMDGYEATLRIRAWEEALPERRQIPIVAVTAHAMKGDRERCLACGMNDYTTKPLEASRLETLITKWLEQENRV